MAAYEESFARFRRMQTFAVVERDESQDSQATYRLHARDAHGADEQRRRIEALRRYGVAHANGTLLVVAANNTFVANFFKPGGQCRPGGACSQMKIEGPQRKGLKSHLAPEPGLACHARKSIEGWSHRPETGANW
jgi:hypothetical protein